MKKCFRLILLLAAWILHTGSFAQTKLVDPAASLLQRILPQRSSEFMVEPLRADDGKDAFEIESKGHQIILRGNNSGSVASALYCYLTEYCHCQITWNGTNLQLPKTLPVVQKIHRQTPYDYRFYLNYCTFNYSMSWWDWPRWEKEIDWMALHGINMPLAITGEEYTWYLVYKEMGFTDVELARFFSGPAFFSWFWMGNLDAWGGPLPLTWMKEHAALQQKILTRERALGMKPVLPAFTGHVPPAFKERFPKAKLKKTNWNAGFADTYILDAEDSLFAEIGKRFLQTQTKLFGTDHFYSADTFNENEPPSDDPAALGKLSASVYEGMRQADTAAVWVMQGWLFYSDRKFWKAPQTEGLLATVPDDKMMILDLATEIEPVWKRTRSFYGKPWIWNMLNNFGGNTNLFGRMETVAHAPAEALQDPNRGKLRGIGMTMEAIEQNPAIYELMMDHVWRDQPIDLNSWLPNYVQNRYGQRNGHAMRAWEIIRNTIYTVPEDKYIRDGAESIIQGRPTLDSLTAWTKTKLNYRAADLLPAWDELLLAADACNNSDGYQYDLVDITRQNMANYALPLQRKWVKAFQQKDLESFKKYSRQFIELIEDLDRLLASRKDFLLGPWISDARKWGRTEAEKSLFEKNARDLITLWGDQDCKLHEYACRQWSGLMNDFYKPRWEQYFRLLETSLQTHQEMNMDAFQKNIKGWEWKWVNERKDFPVQPKGDPIQLSRQMHLKYRGMMAASF